MAESTKRNQNSTSKSRKSRNEIIRSALGLYLKQKNYTATEKYRKSDLALTHTNKQMQYNMLLEDDISKVNSFLYSNVLCLNNNPQLVEQQFSKFLQFVQSQNNQSIKTELQHLLRPLLCHLYIELLKGKASQLATDFLKKFAHLIAPIDNLDNPISNKINGSPVLIQDETYNATPSSSTQILFIEDADIEHTSQGYFKNLVQLMSSCLHIEELDSMEMTRHFRYSKYEMELSLQSLYALKHFLVKNGHVTLMHILQTWFSFEIIDGDDAHQRFLDDDEDDSTGISGSSASKSETETDEIFTKLKKESNSDCDAKISPILKVVKQPEFKKPCAVTVDTKQKDLIMKKSRPNVKLKNLRKSVIKMRLHDEPIRVLKILNADSRLTSGDLDTNECHLVCGFSDSTIRLWQLNNSRIGGRKPYSTYTNRSCEWNLINQSTNFSSDDDDDEDKHMNNKKTKIDLRQSIRLNDPCRDEPANIFSDFEGLPLRGHSRGVTDTIFSKHYPLLFSVSKDLTMRAWKSSDYQCGAVYKGHTYAVWCVAESPLGMYLATGSKDYTARLWSTDRENPLQTYIAHTQDVDAIAFHPNGNYIATGSTDLTVRLWCVTSGKLFRVFTDCHLPVQCVSFSPDGKYLAAAGEETKIRIFDLAAGSQIMELKDHTATVTNVTWHPNGQTLASCCADGSLRIFNVVKNIDQSNTSIASTSSATTTPLSSSSSSATSSSKLLVSYFSDCKQTIKINFNSNHTLSSIGSI